MHQHTIQMPSIPDIVSSIPFEKVAYNVAAIRNDPEIAETERLEKQISAITAEIRDLAAGLQ